MVHNNYEWNSCGVTFSQRVTLWRRDTSDQLYSRYSIVTINRHTVSKTDSRAVYSCCTANTNRLNIASRCFVRKKKKIKKWQSLLRQGVYNNFLVMLELPGSTWTFITMLAVQACCQPCSQPSASVAIYNAFFRDHGTYFNGACTSCGVEKDGTTITCPHGHAPFSNTK